MLEIWNQIDSGGVVTHATIQSTDRPTQLLLQALVTSCLPIPEPRYMRSMYKFID